jgi:2-dehydropantoate 2-reductase
MRIIIFGAGAVGSVVAGRLAQSGANTVVVARAAHADAIQHRGLLLRTGEGEERIPLTAVTELAAIVPEPHDVVVITAKTQDTTRIHDAIAAWNPEVTVVCATNGVEHERMALRRFSRVYAMVVHLPATFETPGEVTALCLPTHAVLDVGRYGHTTATDGTAVELAATINAAPHLSSEPDPNIISKKHDKVLVNLGNGADAACGPIGRTSAVVAAAQEEAKAAYKAAAIVLPDPTDPAVVGYRARMATMKFSVPAGSNFVGGSTWQSVAKGATSVETDYFNGEIALLGRLHGVPTPANVFLQRFVQHMLTHGIPAGSMTPDELDAAWRAGTTAETAE